MRFILGLTIFFPLTVIASGYEGADGFNKRREFLSIYLEYREQKVNGEVVGYDVEEFVSVSKDGGPVEKYSLKECKNSSQYVFSCPRGGPSPLAGTKYIETTSQNYRPCDVEPYFNKSPGRVYKCVEGCENPRAPQIFYIQPWECG